MMKAYRGEILHFIDDPSRSGAQNSYEYFSDGLLVIEEGRVKQLGNHHDIAATLPPEIAITEYKNGLITPGFIDMHTHYPQAEMMASYGEQLLDWLEGYTYPTELRYSDFDYAIKIADFFTNELLDNGTTTAMVFGTVHSASVDAFFEIAQSKKLRMICGKVMMDRNAPTALLDNPDSSYQQSKTLISKWHGLDRLQYAVTPRFAPSCSAAQLDMAARLLKEFPDVYLQTHLAENPAEIAWVKSLFPESEHYLGVYDDHQLLRRRSVFAHGVHLCDDEHQRLTQTQSAVAFCPTSNLFLGSGLFNMQQAEGFGYHVGLATDIGAGTSFSMLRTMAEAYKIQQLRGESLCPFKSFYLATLGAARALDMEPVIGNFNVGKEADFVFLNYAATPLLKLKISRCTTLQQKLFALIILGDDRTVSATHVLGERVV